MKQKALYESNYKINNIYSVLDALLSFLPLSLRRTVLFRHGVTVWIIRPLWISADVE